MMQEDFDSFDRFGNPAAGQPRMLSHGDPAPAVDPVCGRTVDTSETDWFQPFQGLVYYFCGARCLEKFRRDPHAFLAPGLKPKADPATGC